MVHGREMNVARRYHVDSNKKRVLYDPYLYDMVNCILRI